MYRCFTAGIKNSLERVHREIRLIASYVSNSKIVENQETIQELEITGGEKARNMRETIDIIAEKQ